MTGGLLDFFTLEATEYVDQLDALATRSASAAPEAEAFHRAAKGLRGAATMAKVKGIADVAQGLERLARYLRDGKLGWDPSVRGTAIAAIDDLKFLVRGARTWGDAEDKRASNRVAELDHMAPRSEKVIVRGKGAAFLSQATADAAAGLLAYAEQPGTPEAFEDTMRRVRALRGVAALKDLPPLAEVVDALDVAAKPIELRQEDATAERRRLFRAAARVLLEGGEAVRTGGLPPTDTVAVREFAHAAETLRAGERETDDVVPITSLLPPGPMGAHITAAQNPPTTASQRFRLEVVSQAEHLRRLVSEGRSALDPAARDRVGRELRGAVRTLARAAQSFAAIEISNVFLAAERGAAALEPRALGVLEEAAVLLSSPAAGPESVAPRFLDLAQQLAGTPAMGTPTVRPTSPRAPTPRLSGATVPPAAPAAPSAPAPSGAALQALLSTGLEGLAPLGDDPFATPLVGDEDDVVPIDELLFRGREALQRAIELGAGLRESGGVPDHETLDELYDLLQLAAAE